MDIDQELLRALIERRQQKLALMSEQIKKEHHGLDEQVKNLISALDSKVLVPEQDKRN